MGPDKINGIYGKHCNERPPREEKGNNNPEKGSCRSPQTR